MRDERKLDKAIRKDGTDAQSDILDVLKIRYPQYVERQKETAHGNRRRTAVLISVAAAVCAAIVIPCAILLPNRDTPDGLNDRYCDPSEYALYNYEFTVKEYSEKNDSRVMYFDWYNSADDRNTFCYMSNEDNEILGLMETAYLPETDELIYFTVTKSNIYLSELNDYFEKCSQKRIVDSVIVNWALGTVEVSCYFVNEGYRYFISVPDQQDESRLFELVTELLR